MKKRLISVIAILALLFCGSLFMGSVITQQEPAQKILKQAVPVAFRGPTILFVGERVPLYDEKAEERLHYELHINTRYPVQTRLLIRRAYRYFPIIRPILKKYGIPDDFKYLPLIESGFRNSVSSHGAEGPWQFLNQTAQAYGLDINNEVDERYDLAKATVAACRFFKRAHRILGNWTLVAAAYNMGINGLKRAMERQKTDSYYDLDVNTQTSRYVFRLIAIKEIMEHPKRYGFHYSHKSLYAPIATIKIKIDTPIKNLHPLARHYGISYNELCLLNPWIKGNSLSASKAQSYYIRLPKEGKKIENTEEPEFIDDSILQSKTLTSLSYTPDNDSVKIKDSIVVEDNR